MVDKSPESLWTTFKTSLMGVAAGCISEPPRASKKGLSPGTIEIIEESRQARLGGKVVLYRTLRRRAVRAVREDAEARVNDLCQEVESPVLR